LSAESEGFAVALGYFIPLNANRIEISYTFDASLSFEKNDVIMEITV